MDSFFKSLASFLFQTTFIKMPDAIFNNSSIRNTVQSQLSKILAADNFSLLKDKSFSKDSPLPSSILLTRDCFITQWALNLSCVQTRLIHQLNLSPRVLLTFKQTRFKEDSDILYGPSCGFLWDMMLEFPLSRSDWIWIWIALSSNHEYSFIWVRLGICYLPCQQSADWFNEFGLCVFVWVRTFLLWSHWVIAAKSLVHRPFPCIEVVILRPF